MNPKSGKETVATAAGRTDTCKNCVGLAAPDIINDVWAVVGNKGVLSEAKVCLSPFNMSSH